MGARLPRLLAEAYRLPWPGQDREQRWRELIGARSEGSEATVAVEDEVVGVCVAISPTRSEVGLVTGEVAAIYVDPDHWRSGIGAALMNDALTSLAAGRRVIAWCFAGNDRALAFYRAFGFEPDGATQIHPSGRAELRLAR